MKSHWGDILCTKGTFHRKLRGSKVVPLDRYCPPVVFGCRAFFIYFNPLRAGVGPVGPTLFQRLRAQPAVVSKIWKKYLFLGKWIGYIFAKIMFLKKYHFIGVLLHFLSPTWKFGVCLSILWCGCLFLVPLSCHLSHSRTHPRNFKSKKHWAS